MQFPFHKFHELKWNLVWQSLACAFYMAFVLFVMGVSASNSLMWAAGASSLASSAYSVFAVPQSLVAEPKRILSGYVIGCTVGTLVHFLFKYFLQGQLFSPVENLDPHFFWIFAAISVVATLVLMVLWGAQHPPAVGMALIMVMNVSDPRMFLGIAVSIVVLVGIRKFFSKQLKNLVE